MPIKKNELESFKKRLLEMRAKVLGQLKDSTKVVKEPEESKGYSQHQADEGTDDFEKSLSLQLSTQEQYIIKQIDRALEKIEEGSYGICDITQEEIPKARLEAIPYATMTVQAQEKMEKKK